jgi:dipeptidase
MFGAEIGVNEFGVAIGNESLFTKMKPAKVGLTGMDLLRLALERSRSAKEARQVTIDLLEEHGQGGNCGYRHALFYMNSFIIADKDEAFVLETMDKFWAWKQIEGVWSISNRITLEKDFDGIAPGLINYAIKKKWCKSEQDFNFSKCCSNKIITWGARSLKREQNNRKHLLRKQNSLEIADFMQTLRYHSDNPTWRIDRGLEYTVCAHAANNLSRFDQTVSSLVANINQESICCYTTGASNPCLSPYFPVFSSTATLPTLYKEGGEFYNPEVFWWNTERIHRNAVLNYQAAAGLLQPELEKYEKKMLQKVKQKDYKLNQLDVDQYFNEVQEIISNWDKAMGKLPKVTAKGYFRRYWAKYNKLNKIE